MEEHIEKYKVREALLKQVDKILKGNGCYRIDYTEDCALLYYSYPEPERLYKVLKGDFEDYLKFVIPAPRGHQSLVRVRTGDMLIFEAEEEGKVWFTYPKCLIGHEADDMEDAAGFSEHTSLLEMIECGLIGRNTMAPCKPVIKKTIPRIRTAKQEHPEYRIYAPGEGSITRAKNLFGQMKDALLDITNISQYMSNYDNECIRTLKISELPGGGSHIKYRPLPFIRIGGRWVEKAGFQVGDCIQVVTIKDMILIVPVLNRIVNIDDEVLF